MQGYNRFQSIVHWISATVIAFLLITGTFILSEVPNSDPDKLGKLTIHAIVGGVALVLILFRIVWALKTQQPPHIETGAPVMDKLGALAPKLLNILSLVVVLSGVAMGIGSGLMELIVTGMGELPEDFFGSPVRIVHGLSSKVLFAGVIIHILAALMHQLVKKDQIMSRISPFN